MIATYQQAHPETELAGLCRALRISRSWWYARAAQAPDSAQEGTLRDAIERLILQFSGYGYRRVTKQLQREGFAVNHKRVLRIMREEGLLCRLRHDFVRTTHSQHAHKRYPNLLQGRLLTARDQAWVADITYIRLPSRFCFLAAILDAFSRVCVGWHLGSDIDTRLTLAALEMALSKRHPNPGLIHHSDQGVQYAASEYVSRLEQVGARLSMARTGTPYENAQAESFFKTLKQEEVYVNAYQHVADAKTHIGPFLEEVYNTKRLHSSLGYLPPAEFEARQAAASTHLPAET
ncbi:MAG TPA: IS3 family transposase [Chthonomonadaceae bacterium]|nr:IS3 family transposase [Chthonomonadaceae bacterium]